eukprot:SAG31_NODE_1512_length_8055_cov_3.286199_4_plen_142_part_00
MRFLKPQGILEVGAGYTSLWLLQALADNTAELSRCAAALQTDGYQVGGASWLLPPETGWQQKHADATPTLLHCVDDMTHENTTAHLVEAISQRLGTSHHLRIHAVDAYGAAKHLIRRCSKFQTYCSLDWATKFTLQRAPHV